MMCSQETITNEPKEDSSGGDDGKGASAVKTGGDNRPSATSQLSSNPLRSLGDALKEVRRNLDQILESGDRLEEAEEQNVDSDDIRQLQYIRPDENDEAMQALGAAGDEQAAKLSDLKLIDEEQPEEAVPMDVDPITAVEQSKQPQPPAHQSTGKDSEGRADLESGLTQDQVRLHRAPNDQTANNSELATLPAPSDTKLSDDNAQLDVESKLREWQAQGYPEHDAESIWRLYESLTHDLSYALCEQLRLILEPTQATRLKGDYRSGKRLNMKKIIPYIASEYTKDKIWLRRTKPSKREYQVLICLDDSRSMSESHSVHLAYQTLALVSKALGRLEVGDIAIAKFGQTVDVLHGFSDGRPFTDQAGTELINSFRFDQKATNVLALIDTSLKILEQARELRSGSSASAADLWQLEIIVSDGICQDHERLRTALRRAEEQRVMIVFIILDSLHSHVEGASASSLSSSSITTAASSKGNKIGNTDPIRNSILSMQQGIAVKNENGVMEVKMERYLDSFPFEYYVVLRDVEALPDILSGTVKQFFERISED
jgi:midasin